MTKKTSDFSTLDELLDYVKEAEERRIADLKRKEEEECRKQYEAAIAKLTERLEPALDQTFVDLLGGVEFEYDIRSNRAIAAFQFCDRQWEIVPWGDGWQISEGDVDRAVCHAGENLAKVIALALVEARDAYQMK